ncbi:hypothetical protein K504DRAFT_96853 [Pleomassaria siparia CBS 279.74]|uniref:Uncharacterized protein n=1 Tax=Pleomassaria siparia CBS 279.74 TaxID=1314801 RepID=A0A6G1JXG9_9PLEO|nr:hypothetical protein K504DRAFT_96853 [Pleomassaria siparia CBS 279.74]
MAQYVPTLDRVSLPKRLFIISALTFPGRILEEDSRIAQAHVPNQYFMDHGFRRYTSVNRGTRAPNGQFLSCYGSHGDAVGTSFTTPRKCDDDLFRNFFLKRLEGSLTSKIYLQCWKWYHKIFNRELGPEPQGLGGRPLEVVVTAVEYTIFVSCLAGPIALLSSLDAIRDRIIAASFSSLAFPYIAVFLSKEASKTFMLVAAYWAVLAVFIATSGSGSKSC